MATRCGRARERSGTILARTGNTQSECGDARRNENHCGEGTSVPPRATGATAGRAILTPQVDALPNAGGI